MRIADSYLKEVIAQGGSTRQGPLSREAACRLALDLREAREQILALREEISEYERLSREPRRAGGKIAGPRA